MSEHTENTLACWLPSETAQLVGYRFMFTGEQGYIKGTLRDFKLQHKKQLSVKDMNLATHSTCRSFVFSQLNIKHSKKDPLLSGGTPACVDLRPLGLTGGRTLQNERME